ncbi:hypothetical protein CRENPOLYSF2_3790001 [Crenothrix polyspora]|uniref:Uncharacterized protein n=1 Tax=Crenothrix polyspora TaxID=360316 RepID=A0A1R4HD62_9GAMM|nr:hypothetical protein [Crenothrix polyspora]SJM94156.1 hypothetical protein CRENPOLYSF2_3790001 [Crenothrix polyspora]
MPHIGGAEALSASFEKTRATMHHLLAVGAFASLINIGAMGRLC